MNLHRLFPVYGRRVRPVVCVLHLDGGSQRNPQSAWHILVVLFRNLRTINVEDIDQPEGLMNTGAGICSGSKMNIEKTRSV